MESLLECAESAVKRPSDYAYNGDLDLFITWGYFGPARHRDSDTLEVSNFEVIWADVCEKFPDDLEVVHNNHWAVGWIDQIAVRVYDENGEITNAFKSLYEWAQKLENYPVADEMDHSNREHKDFMETLKNCYYPTESFIDSKSVRWDILDLEVDYDAVASILFDDFNMACSDDLDVDSVNQAYITLGYYATDEGF